MTYWTGYFLVSIYRLLFWGEQVPVPSGYEFSLGEPFLLFCMELMNSYSSFNAWLKQPLSVNAWFSLLMELAPLFPVLSSVLAHAGLPEWYLAFSLVSLCGSVEAQSELSYWLWWFWHTWQPRTAWLAWILQFPELCLACSQIHKACRGTTQVFEGLKQSNTKKKIPLSSSQDSSLVSTLGTKTFPPNVPVVDGCCQSSHWHLHKIPNLLFL